MKIKLQRIELKNFKGIKELAFDFEQKNTISGANGTGKTTIADAWYWLLTGKNFSDQTDSGRGSFQVMTTNAEGDIIRDIEHRVDAIIEKDGGPIRIGRSVAQVWEVVNGDEKPTLKGNQTKFYYNGVEVKKTKFTELLYFIGEDFRLKTIPGAFMAQDWKTQREMLLAYTGNITLESQAETDNDRAIIETILKVGFDIWKKDVSAKKKNIKAELATIPGKIDTAEKLKPEARDWAAIEKDIEETEKALTVSPIQTRVKELDRKKAEMMADYNKATTKAQAEMFELRKKQTELENAQKEAEAANENHRQKLINEKAELIANIETLQKKRDILREQFKTTQAENYTIREVGKEFKCPLVNDLICNNPILLANAKEAEKMAQSDFYKNKENKLAEFNTTGKSYNSEIKHAEAKIKAIDTLLREPKPELPHIQEIEKIKNKIMDLNAKAPKAPDTSAIDKEIEDIIKDKEAEKIYEEQQRRKIRDLQMQLADRKAIEKAEQEILQNKARQKELQTQLGQVEAEEFAGDTLKKKQMTEVEKAVNDNFKVIQFKLFEKQINGGEADTCQVFINGVPYGRGANKAAEINAQLEIIEFLQRSADFYAPVFIDNTESVNDLRDIETQTMALKVTTEPTLSITF